MTIAGLLKVLVVDDHAMVLSAIAGVIESTDDMEVVGACADADEAIAVALRERPDVLLMDIDMPGISSFDAARTIQSHLPAVRVVFLTAYPHDRYIEQAIALEASGFLTKNETPEAMLNGLREVARGHSCFSVEVESRLILDGGGARLASARGTRRSTLSIRELEVLRYIASGMTKKEIAGVMHLAVKTVDNHSTNLMSKLDIHDRVELTKYAIREGLVCL